MNTGTEGMGMAWLDVATYGASPAIPDAPNPDALPAPGGNPSVVIPDWGWEAPNLPRAFGVGFDASDPPNRDPFRGSGNVYDRPQHEVSLHWNGIEIVKKATPSDFRDEKPHRVRLRIEFVTGGADVSLSIDDQPLLERYFIASMTAFVGRPVFGARNGETAGDVLIDDVVFTCSGAADAPPPPVSVVVFDRVLNDAGHSRNEAVVQLPDDLSRFGRIVATLRLDKPESRFDPWDRSAHIWIEDASGGERYELIRYITPYHRGFEWQVDASDFRPLLSGARRFTQECGTQGEGWLVSMKLDYYPGRPPGRVVARRIVTLWCGAPEIGNPDRPAAEFYTRRSVAIDDWVKAARVRMVVTGHGMSPNSQNAAEFMPIGRTLRINGREHRNQLWKTDNYLNPCRPQGGTWKYDRAGWAPGDVVRAWEVDAGETLAGSKELRIEYELDAYVNENRGQTWAPFHLTQSQLILYGPADAGP
jgi:hypothetical protein